MTALDQIREHIEQLNTQQFKQYLMIIFASMFLVSSVIIYRYYSTVQSLKKRITFINKKRETVRNILEKNETVKQQQADVAALIAKTPTFRIPDFFNTLKIADANKAGDPIDSSEQLDNGYTEFKLEIRLQNMNMQNLVELLDTIEKDERIYTKNLEISKSDQGSSINVDLTIATLEPTLKSAEKEE